MAANGCLQPQEYLNQKRIEESLAKNRQYQRAVEVRSAAEDLFNTEMEAAQAAYEAEQRLRVAKFTAKQQQEFEALLQRGARGRDELELKRAAETERRNYRFRNIVMVGGGDGGSWCPPWCTAIPLKLNSHGHLISHPALPCQLDCMGGHMNCSTGAHVHTIIPSPPTHTSPICMARWHVFHFMLLMCGLVVMRWTGAGKPAQAGGGAAGVFPG